MAHKEDESVFSSSPALWVGVGVHGNSAVEGQHGRKCIQPHISLVSGSDRTESELQTRVFPEEGGSAPHSLWFPSNELRQGLGLDRKVTPRSHGA